MPTEKELTDESLGKIHLRSNPHARHIILRARREGILVTMPVGTTLERVREVLDKYRQRLEDERRQLTQKAIGPGYRIRTELFELSFETGTQPRFLARSEPGRLTVVCPPEADFDDEQLQQWLRKVAEEALKKNAKALLPQRLQALSIRWKLPYKQVRISSSKGRWGSCSAKRHISLSCYLLLLPAHLVDYVLLHELAHTREMNHGEGFWQLLGTMTDGKARDLRNELKQYHTEI